MEENKDGGNGGLEKQSGPEIAEEEITILTIFVGKVSKRVGVRGLIEQKTLCMNAIAEAIKAVANFEPSPIIQPPGGMAGLARRFLHRR